MMWLLFAVLLVFARHADCGALRCSEGSSCTAEEESKAPPIPVTANPSPREAECQPGSEWESNCHSCRCSESGIAECLKQNACDKGASVEPVRCKPNTTVERECNTCICLEDGLGLCTLKSCAKNDPELPSGDDCAPGSSWKNQCNSCWCSKRGYATCTLMGCFDYTEPQKLCAPNTSWRKECNICQCTSEGQPVCTEMKCRRDTTPPIPVIANPSPREAECQPGSEWESNCHSCRCSESGIAECLKQNACDKGASVEPVRCKPNTTVERECNTCICLEDGLGLCTLKSCAKNDPELPSGYNCAPGSSWRNQCNSCWCSEGYAACTLMGCFGYSEPEILCAPNTSWRKECNICQCTSEGQPVCTEMKCRRDTSVNLAEVDENSEHAQRSKPKALTAIKIEKRATRCEPNAEFKSECNVCKCSANGRSFSCTHNECLEGDSVNSDVEVFQETDGADHIERHSVCQPHTIFYIACNACQCNSLGTDFACTLKPCPLPRDVEVFHELRVTQATLSRKIRAFQEVPKQCQPGQEFRLDCNKCLCDNEGQNFSCTRMDCNALNNHNGDAFSSRTKRETGKEEMKCVPGSVFERDCNVCRCADEGLHAVCTLKRCAVDGATERPAPGRAGRGIQM